MMGSGWTPYDLERFLVDSVTGWVNDPPILCRNPYDPSGPYIAPVVYQGRIPSVQAGPQSETTFKAPSVAICCTDFRYKRESGVATVSMPILTWDDDLSRNGYGDVHNIINRIVYGLYQAGIIGQSFILLDETVDGELIFDPAVDYFGYFLGNVTAKFGLATPIPDPGQPVIGQEGFLIS
jgi:hypothetical protein